MIKLALIGKDLTYSKSAQMHGFIAKQLGEDIVYDYFQIPPQELESTAGYLLKNYRGFNITIPYKEDIIPLLDTVSGDAQTFKSVNTVICKENAGYNTDGEGFMLMLRTEGIEVADKNVLVLGSGGAAKSCIYKLSRAGAKVDVYNRTYEKAAALHALYGGFTPLKTLEQKKYDIIINTTSVGMTQLTGQMPVAPDFLQGIEAAVDLIYNPRQTKFLNLAAQLGKKTVNGEKMLFFQAYYADMLYFNRQGSDGEAQRLFAEYKKI